MNKTLGPILGDAGKVALAALVVSCASVPVPTEQMQASAATIRAAEEVGAENVPTAALHLELAKEQLNQAEKLIETGEDEPRMQAKFLLARAKSDADLALALAREHKDRRETQDVLDRLHSVQQESMGTESMEEPMEPESMQPTEFMPETE